MKNLLKLVTCVGLFLNYSLPLSASERIELETGGNTLKPALMFKTESKRVAVLAHQMGGTMESWTDFAKFLNGHNIGALSLSSVTSDSILSAIKHLDGAGYEDIILIGASMGGGGILKAMARDEQPHVGKVILLSPSSANPLTSTKVDKLIIAEKEDYWGYGTYIVFEEATEPKRLIEYEGRLHGQALLEGENGDNIRQEIVEFLLLP